MWDADLEPPKYKQKDKSYRKPFSQSKDEQKGNDKANDKRNSSPTPLMNRKFYQNGFHKLSLKSNESTAETTKNATKGKLNQNRIQSKSSHSIDQIPSQRRRPLDNHAISIWAENMAKRDRTAEAIRFLHNKLSNPPSSNPRANKSIVLYNTAIDICAQAGDIDGALEFWRMAKGNKVPWNGRTIASLIHAMVKGVEAGSVPASADRLRLFDRAVQLAREYLDQRERKSVGGLEIFAYNALINLACRVGRLNDLFQLLEPKNCYSDLRPERLDVYSFTSAYHGLAKLGGSYADGQYCYGLQTAAGIQPDAQCLIALLTLAKADLKSRKRTCTIVNLMQIKDRMAALQSLSSEWPTAFHSLLLDCFVSLEAWQDAQRYIADCIDPIILRASGKRKFPLDMYTASLIVRVYVRSGEFEQVFPCYERLLKAGLRRPSLHMANLLLEACARRSQPWGRRAISYYEGIFGFGKARDHQDGNDRPANRPQPDQNTLKWMRLALRNEASIDSEKYLRDIESRLITT